MRGVILLLAALMLLYPYKAHADWKDDFQNSSRVQFGQLCLDRVPKGAMRVYGETTQINGVTWNEFSFYVSTGFAGKARLTIARKGAPSNPVSPKCPEGASTHLSGIVQAIDLRGYIKSGPMGVGYELLIPRYQLKGSLTSSPSNLGSIFGAKVALRSKDAIDIANPSDMKFGPSAVTGSLDIKSYDRVLDGAAFVVPGSVSSTKLLLRQVPKTVSTLRVDMNSGALSIREGEFVQSKPNFPLQGWSIAGLALVDAKASVGQARLSAHAGIATFALDAVGFSASSGNYALTPAFSAVAPSGNVTSLSSLVTQDPKVGRIGPWEVADAKIHSGQFRFSAPGSLDGPGILTVTTYQPKPANIVGELKLNRTNSAILSFAFPRGFRQLSFKFSGDPNRLTPSLVTADAEGLVTGPVALSGAGAGPKATEVALDFDLPELVIPFKWEAGPIKGSAIYSNASAEIVLEAELQKIRLAGTISIPVQTPQQARLTIAKGDFALAFGASVTKRPIANGQKLEFAAAGFSAESIQPIEIRRVASSGALRLAADAGVILSPTVTLGEGTTSMELDVNLKSTASIEVEYDLATAQGEIVAGRFEATGVSAKPTKPGIAIIDSLQLENPAFGVKRVAASFAKGGGSFAIEGAEFSATSAQEGDAGSREKEYWRAVPSSPIGFAVISGTIKRDPNALSFDVDKVEGLGFSASQLSFIGMDGFQYTTSRASQIGPIRMDKAQWDGALSFGAGTIRLGGSTAGQAKVDYLTLRIFGPRNSPSGVGQVKISDIDLKFASDIDVGGGCPKAPATAEVKSQGGEGNFSISAGSMKGTITLALTNVYYHNDSWYECVRPAYTHKFWDEECISWDWGLLGKGEICKPEASVTFKWKTIITLIGVDVISDGATVDFGAGDASGNKRICLGTFVPVAVLPTIASSAPQISTSIPLINDLINPVISLVVGLAESAVLTVVTSSIFWTDSLFSLVDKKTLCF